MCKVHVGEIPKVPTYLSVAYNTRPWPGRAKGKAGSQAKRFALCPPGRGSAPSRDEMYADKYSSSRVAASVAR